MCAFEFLHGGVGRALLSFFTGVLASCFCVSIRGNAVAEGEEERGGKGEMEA